MYPKEWALALSDIQGFWGDIYHDWGYVLFFSK